MKYVDGFYTRDILRLSDYDGTGYYCTLSTAPYHTSGLLDRRDRWKWTECTDGEDLTGNRLIADLKVLKW